MPVTEQRSLEVRAALDASHKAVNELLRPAVVESRAARERPALRCPAAEPVQFSRQQPMKLKGTTA